MLLAGICLSPAVLIEAQIILYDQGLRRAKGGQNEKLPDHRASMGSP